jgi:hypothetical protein
LRGDFAEGVRLHIVGDAQAAPRQAITAAVPEHAAQQRDERQKKKAPGPLPPIHGPALQRQPGVDGDQEFLLERGAFGLERLDRPRFPARWPSARAGRWRVLVGLLALGDGLLHAFGIGDAVGEGVNAADDEAVGYAEKDAEDDAEHEARPIARKVRPRKAHRGQEGIHG